MYLFKQVINPLIHYVINSEITRGNDFRINNDIYFNEYKKNKDDNT